MSHAELPGHEIIRVLSGSRAYGLADEQSDMDYHGVFVQPTADLVKMQAKPRTAHILPASFTPSGVPTQGTLWELRHFLEAVTNGNPTMLELFWSPVVTSSEIGEELRELAPYVLNRMAIYNGFKHYAERQRDKMFNPDAEMAKLYSKNVRQRKAAIAYIRVLAHGVDLLQTGRINVMLQEGDVREACINLRNGSIDLLEGLRTALVWEHYLEEAYNKSRIPMVADLERVNRFLVHVRQEVWH